MPPVKHNEHAARFEEWSRLENDNHVGVHDNSGVDDTNHNNDGSSEDEREEEGDYVNARSLAPLISEFEYETGEDLEEDFQVSQEPCYLRLDSQLATEEYSFISSHFFSKRLLYEQLPSIY